VKKYLAVCILFIVAILIKAPFTVLHSEKTFPADTKTYASVGTCFIKTFFGGERNCYQTEIKKSFFVVYGPLFSVVTGSWIWLGGMSSPTWMRLLSVLSESVSVVVVYLISLELLDDKKAIRVTLVYMFSYMCFINSSIVGNDDSHAILFSLLSVYLMIKGEEHLSAVSIAVALLFKQIPLAFMPSLLLYMYKEKNLRAAVSYAIFVATIFIIVFMSFFLIVGEPAMTTYTFGTSLMDGYTPANLLRMTFVLPYHTMHPELPLNFASLSTNDPWNYNGTHWFSRLIRLYVSLSQILGLLLYAFIVLKYRIKDIKVELLRNVVLLMLITFLFGKLAETLYFVWFLPFTLILLKKTNDLDKKQFVLGCYLIVVSVVIYGTTFRWVSPMYDPIYHMTFNELLMLNFAIINATVGSYFIFNMYSKQARNILTLLVFVFALGETMHARPFYVLSPVASFFVSDKIFALVSYFAAYWLNSLLASIAYIVLILQIIKGDNHA
jgi:hypothetical protein